MKSRSVNTNHGAFDVLNKIGAKIQTVKNAKKWKKVVKFENFVFNFKSKINMKKA